MKKLITILGSIILISSAHAGFNMNVTNVIQFQTSDGESLHATMIFDVIAMTRVQPMWRFYCLPWASGIECAKAENVTHQESIMGMGKQVITNTNGKAIVQFKDSSINPYEEGWFIHVKSISVLRVPICNGRSFVDAVVCSGPFKEGGCGDSYEEYSDLPQFTFRLASRDGKVIRHLSLENNQGVSSLQGTSISREFTFNREDDATTWSASNSNLKGQIVNTNLIFSFTSTELEEAARDIETANGCH